MRICIVLTAVVAMAGQFATPTFAASAFNATTMLGSRQIAGPTAMAYVRVPFHARKIGRFQPRAGFMVTAPQSYRPGTLISRASIPGIIDFGFTGRDFHHPWTATLNVGDVVAWSGNPDALPKNTVHLFESGASPAVVGAVTVGAIAGTLALVDRPK